MVHIVTTVLQSVKRRSYPPVLPSCNTNCTLWRTDFYQTILTRVETLRGRGTSEKSAESRPRFLPPPPQKNNAHKANILFEMQPCFVLVAWCNWLNDAGICDNPMSWMTHRKTGHCSVGHGMALRICSQVSTSRLYIYNVETQHKNNYPQGAGVLSWESRAR